MIKSVDSAKLLTIDMFENEYSSIPAYLEYRDPEMGDNGWTVINKKEFREYLNTGYRYEYRYWFQKPTAECMKREGWG